MDETKEALIEMVFQFAYTNSRNELHTGGLSALEEAFEVLGIPDPCPIPTLRDLVEQSKKLDAPSPASSDSGGDGSSAKEREPEAEHEVVGDV